MIEVNKITNIEQIDTKIKKYELKKYLNEKCNNEEWKNKILTRIENRKITTYDCKTDGAYIKKRMWYYMSKKFPYGYDINKYIDKAIEKYKK